MHHQINVLFSNVLYFGILSNIDAQCLFAVLLRMYREAKK